MRISPRTKKKKLAAEIKHVANGATVRRIPFMHNTKHKTMILPLSFRDRY